MSQRALLLSSILMSIFAIIVLLHLVLLLLPHCLVTFYTVVTLIVVVLLLPYCGSQHMNHLHCTVTVHVMFSHLLCVAD